MSPPSTIAKAEIIAALRAHIANDLAAATASQQATQAGATHEESRPENDKDTRALESTYLARGLAQRVAELQTAASQLANLLIRPFRDDESVSLSALVTVQDDHGRLRHYFIAPCGGGVKLQVSGGEVSVVTPASPLGHALLGKRADDEVQLRTARGPANMVISDIR